MEEEQGNKRSEETHLSDEEWDALVMGEETSEAVRNHLNECATCRAVAERLTADADPVNALTLFAARRVKHRRFPTFLVATTTMIFLLVAFMFGFGYWRATRSEQRALDTTHRLLAENSKCESEVATLRNQRNVVADENNKSRGVGTHGPLWISGVSHQLTGAMNYYGLINSCAKVGDCPAGWACEDGKCINRKSADGVYATTVIAFEVRRSDWENAKVHFRSYPDLKFIIAPTPPDSSTLACEPFKNAAFCFSNATLFVPLRTALLGGE